ncbi:MAG: hypothetical protein ACRD88_23085, partial [Terriglobia bacterium]
PSWRDVSWTAALFALLGIVLAGGAELAAAQTGPATESGVFLIRAGGRNIGTERFQIRQVASGWEATGELQLEVPGGTRVTETCSLRVDASWKPASYQREQQSPRRGTLTADFRPEGTMLAAKAGTETQEQIFLLPERDLVVLDTNFFHQYGLLLRQYDIARPGPQNFHVFVPQEATPSTISLVLLGKETLDSNGAPAELNHFQASTEDIKIEIWATDQREIRRIEIPQATLEIVRQTR